MYSFTTGHFIYDFLYVILGGGLSDLESLCADMNMPPPMAPTAYSALVEKIKVAAETQATISMKNAAAEVHELQQKSANEIVDCTAMFDGTWRKRGHSSLQGVVTCITPLTGKVLDYTVLNKICGGCSYLQTKKSVLTDTQFDEKKEAHDFKCKINYTGSAGAMEPAGVEAIYKRSEDERGLRYVNYIGDGDSKSFSHINSVEPYGPDITLKKLECVGHVQKRMGTALRKHKHKLGKKKLSDGKSIGGQKRLTDKKIDKLQIYYGLAIRRNKNDLPAMKREVMAGLYHSASTDSKPQHQFCPPGSDSWCGWQLEVAEREKMVPVGMTTRYSKRQQQTTKMDNAYVHKDPLPAAIVDELLPIYERLSDSKLLEKCLDGFTQNSCESVNSLIWSRCPKHTSTGKISLDFGVADAVSQFNDGKMSHSDMLKHLGISSGKHSCEGLQKRNQRRISQSKRSATKLSLKMRQSKRQQKKTQEEHDRAVEGIVYEAGEF